MTSDRRLYVFGDGGLTAKVIVNEKKPELDLIDQLKADGHDVIGAKLRIIAMHDIAKRMLMCESTFEEFQDRLEELAKFSDKHNYPKGFQDELISLAKISEVYSRPRGKSVNFNGRKMRHQLDLWVHRDQLQ